MSMCVHVLPIFIGDIKYYFFENRDIPISIGFRRGDDAKTSIFIGVFYPPPLPSYFVTLYIPFYNGKHVDILYLKL